MLYFEAIGMRLIQKSPNSNFQLVIVALYSYYKYQGMLRVGCPYIAVENMFYPLLLSHWQNVTQE